MKVIDLVLPEHFAVELSTGTSLVCEPSVVTISRHDITWKCEDVGVRLDKLVHPLVTFVYRTRDNLEEDDEELTMNCPTEVTLRSLDQHAAFDQSFPSLSWKLRVHEVIPVEPGYSLEYYEAYSEAQPLRVTFVDIFPE